MKFDAESSQCTGWRCAMKREIQLAITLVSRWLGQSVLVSMGTADHFRPSPSRQNGIDAGVVYPTVHEKVRGPADGSRRCVVDRSCRASGTRPHTLDGSAGFQDLSLETMQACREPDVDEALIEPGHPLSGECKKVGVLVHFVPDSG